MTQKLTDTMPVSPADAAVLTAEREFSCHRMHVLHTDGLYRHLRFANPTSSFYSFSIVTWPGSLAISGDLGAELWSRDTDMLDFFHTTGRPDLRYWAEKVQTDASPYAFSERRVREWVENALEDVEPKRAAGLRQRVVDEVLTDDISEDERLRALYDIDELGWDGDASMREITHQAALRMLAVQHAALAWRRHTTG